jgi:hypothetical protein
MAGPTHELFHEIADPASARLRRLVVEGGLKDRVAFRNVSYPEALADLVGRGGVGVPALWDGSRLHAGEAAARAELVRLAAADGPAASAADGLAPGIDGLSPR